MDEPSLDLEALQNELTAAELRDEEAAKLGGSRPKPKPKPEPKKRLETHARDPRYRSVGGFHLTPLADASMYDVQRVLVRGLVQGLLIFSLIWFLLMLCFSLFVWLVMGLLAAVVSSQPA